MAQGQANASAGNLTPDAAGDRFHPSGAGYAKAVAALLPPAVQELRFAIDADQTIVVA